MASGTLPEFYDPKEIGGRMFWDGGLLSNTPLRELIQSHREYWVNVEKRCGSRFGCVHSKCTSFYNKC
jgi:predicted acylesterase/phospholipase RssA